MTIKSDLQKLTKFGQQLKKRTDEGNKYFEKTVKQCKKAALSGQNFTNINLTTFRPTTSNRDKIQPNIQDLTELEQELYDRLDKAGFLLKILHYEERDIQSGPYGEDEYTAKTALRITW